jgi:hypothetical protein
MEREPIKVLTDWAQSLPDSAFVPSRVVIVSKEVNAALENKFGPNKKNVAWEQKQ